jgi:hypothetical protein
LTLLDPSSTILGGENALPSKSVTALWPCQCGAQLLVTWQPDGPPYGYKENIVCPACNRGYYLPSEVIKVEIKPEQ